MNKRTNQADLKYVKETLLKIRNQADSIIKEIESDTVTRAELVERMEAEVLSFSAIDFENALLAQRSRLA